LLCSVKKDSALSVLADEPKQVFALTATTGKLAMAASQKRDIQNSVPSRQQKIAKKSNSYDNMSSK